MKSEAFLAEVESRLFAEDLATGTVERVLIDARQLAEWYEQTNGEPLTVEALRGFQSIDLRDYRAYLTGRVAPSTLVRKFASIRKVFVMLAPERLAEIGWVKVPRVQRTSPSGFTETQRRAIRRAVEKLSIRDRAICYLLLNTGGRASSIAGAKLSGLVLGERSGSITYTGKGNTVYTVPLNHEARTALRDWLAVRPPVASDFVFVGQKYPYARISRWLVHNVWHERLKRLLVPAVAEIIRGPHQARHALGRLLVSGSEGQYLPIPLADASAILGHSSVRTTASTYCVPSKENLQDALDRIGGEE